MAWNFCYILVRKLLLSIIQRISESYCGMSAGKIIICRISYFCFLFRKLDRGPYWKGRGAAVEGSSRVVIYELYPAVNLEGLRKIM